MCVCVCGCEWVCVCVCLLFVLGEYHLSELNVLVVVGKREGVGNQWTPHSCACSLCDSTYLLLVLRCLPAPHLVCIRCILTPTDLL